ncbi:MAG: beta-ketoacyl-[acyl-carrier-protein] synthase family protein [Armatimonadota bacterium]|nr:beta-ketoacyl-[acyl-carrier-protein] synthase family protein [Armatimonadota bacterium]
MSARRVVLTGLGCVTPLGIGASDFWSALLEGRSAVTRLNLADDGAEPRHLVAPAPGFDIRSFVSNRKLLRIMCRTDRFGLAAAQMAAAEAGEVAPPPERRGAYLATRKDACPVDMLFDAIRASRGPTGGISPALLGEQGFAEFPPMTLVTGMPNGCLFAISVLHSIKGAGSTLLGRGDVGLAAIGAAYRAIQGGQVDWALAGAHDDGTDRWTYADLIGLGLISNWQGDPSQAVKPFDRRRDGFAPGEGAAMVVLEDLEDAQARGAKIQAEIVGYAETCQALALDHARLDGSALARAISAALQQAELAPEDVDYVSACGSATVIGDRTEIEALEKVFGGGARRPLVAGIKGAIGHLLAASGAVEFAATVLALQHQMVPPTLNLVEPEPECRFDLVPGRARKAAVRTAITISRGIGGQNAVIALRRWEP